MSNEGVRKLPKSVTYYLNGPYMNHRSYLEFFNYSKIIINTRIVADDLVDRVATYSALNEAHSSIGRRLNNDMRMVDITKENPSNQNTASMANPSIKNTATPHVRNANGSSLANSSDQNTFSVSDARC